MERSLFSSGIGTAARVAVAAALLGYPAAAHAASVELRAAVGVPGGRVVVSGVLHTMDVRIAGVQLDMSAGEGMSVPVNSRGRPACESLCRSDYVPPADSVAPFSSPLDEDPVGGPAKECAVSHNFAFTPAGCTPGVDCAGIRYLELSLDVVEALPDGGTLFQCTVEIDADARLGPHTFGCHLVQTANTNGEPVPATCSDAAINVVCPGDCDADGTVTVAELVKGFAIVHGEAPRSDCPVLDSNLSRSVTIDELVRARVSLLSGCGS